MSKNVMLVVIGVAMIGSMEPLLATCIQPTTCDPVNGCVNSGPPVCSGNSRFLTLYTIGQESTSYWPPGGSGSGYVGIDPNTPKLNCAMQHYAPIKWQSGWSNSRIRAFAWTDAARSQIILTSNYSPPVGYTFPIAGMTNTQTRTTLLYGAAYSSYNRPYYYIDPNNQAGGVISYTPNWSSIQMELATATHEAGHQRDNGGTNETLYNGYGKEAVDAYNADGGAACASQPNF